MIPFILPLAGLFAALMIPFILPLAGLFAALMIPLRGGLKP